MSYIVKKANRVLTVPDEKLEEYQGMGYTIMDMSGNVISEPAPVGKEAANKIAELKAENKDLKEKLKEASLYAENRDKEIAELKAENQELQKKLETPEPVEAEPESVSTAEASEKPVKAASTKKK